MLVSVLGEKVTVLGSGVVVVGEKVTVLGSGVVMVTVCVGPPPPPWCGVGPAAVVVGVAVVEGVGVVVVAGPRVGDPLTSVTTANITNPSTITPMAPNATSASGRRYQGVGGSGGS